jgi:hypothetical protein
MKLSPPAILAIFQNLLPKTPPALGWLSILTYSFTLPNGFIRTYKEDQSKFSKRHFLDAFSTFG